MNKITSNNAENQNRKAQRMHGVQFLSAFGPTETRVDFGKTNFIMKADMWQCANITITCTSAMVIGAPAEFELACQLIITSSQGRLQQGSTPSGL